MVVLASEMVRDVRVAIDMNRTDEPLMLEGDADTLELDEVIRGKLADAVRLVEMEAPAVMLEGGHDFVASFRHDTAVDPSYAEATADNLFIGEDGKGFVILPPDFMRLVAFRMSDWRRTVFDAISESDPKYALQSSRWKGVCGNREKPVCAIVRRAEGKVLEFYSCNDNTATVVQASYIPIPHIDCDGGIDVARDCYRAAVYRAAALALGSMGDSLSATMMEMSKALLQ